MPDKVPQLNRDEVLREVLAAILRIEAALSPEPEQPAPLDLVSAGAN